MTLHACSAAFDRWSSDHGFGVPAADGGHGVLGKSVCKHNMMGNGSQHDGSVTRMHHVRTRRSQRAIKDGIQETYRNDIDMLCH